MPSITRPVAILDLDTCDVYRLGNLSTDRNSAGDFVNGFKLIHSGYAVNHHGTHNFDERFGRALPAILKKQNIMTSDVIDCDISLDIRAEDVVKITTRDGRVLWQMVMGDPDKRPLSGYQTFYTTPTPEPKVS